MEIKRPRKIQATIGRAGIIFLLFSFLFCYTALGQLQVNSLTRTSQLHERTKNNARTKATAPLNLPFFDDFSRPYVAASVNGVYPDTMRWEDGLTVWVNDGLGINPPTINVATFDGLDANGRAYNANEIFLNGFTDSLVSRPIDLSETAPTNPVSIAERNSVYLSFFYQWKGNGESPDADDYLQVQFRNASNQWETVSTINTTASLEKEKFYEAIVKVDGDRFFTDHFQFRFRTFGRQSGPYDTWNIDYVYLNKSRTATDIGFPDGAISSPLTTIFPGQYRAVPYYHFLNAPTVIAPTFQVSNRRAGDPDVLTYFVEGTFTNYFYSATDTTTTQISPTPPAPTGINDNGGAIFPFETRTVTVKQINTIDTVNTLDPDADAATIDLKTVLITGDNVNPQDGTPAVDYHPKYIPIEFRLNDTIQTRYELKNFYAYDDGVAEYAGGLIAAGNVFAYQFDLPENLNDTLKILEAFDIYFPAFGLQSSQNVDFFVFDEQNGRPNKILVRISSVSIRNEGTNKFQRIRFLPAIQITQKTFFVGWRQPISGQVLVGIDNSNDTGNKMFFNTEGSINPDPSRWEENRLIKGSFMVRPVFGTGIVDPTTGIEEDTRLAVFPNPNQGSFQISGKPQDIAVLSVTGQSVAFESDVFDDKTYVRLNAPSGLYVVRYRSNGVLHAQKIIVTQ